MPSMTLSRLPTVLPILLLASAGQPTYRLGAFIETLHADCRVCSNAEEPGGDGPGDSTKDDAPEPSWPVELVALLPASIGLVEQPGSLTSLEVRDLNPPNAAYSPWLKRWATRAALTISAEPLAAASIGVVAHPIHPHAPPPNL